MNISPPNNEKVLLMHIAQGSEKAFRMLYDSYYNKIFSVSFKLTKERTLAEDIVQEVFIKLWVNKEKLIEIENLNAYLNTVIRNHVINGLRKLAYEEIFLAEMIAKGDPVGKDTFDTVVYNELRERLRDAISHLTPQQKKVYQLSRVEGLKHEEIAGQMNISRETVKKHISEALRAIKKHLGDDEISLVFIGLLFFCS